MQPRVERAAAHRAEQRDQELRQDQRRELLRRVADIRNQREREDHEARNSDCEDGDLLPLAHALHQRDGGKLRDLRKKRNRREQADDEWRSAQLEREANQDHAAVEGAHQARPCSVLHQRALAARRVFGRHIRIGMQPHRSRISSKLRAERKKKGPACRGGSSGPGETAAALKEVSVNQNEP